MPVTPMMQQYLDTKEKCGDAILFFRLGDFYEMFFDDAKTVSRELELTLTGKDCGLSERAPMCGVPYHAVDIYVGKLIEKGYKVAICEQMTDPALSKGLVEREITRVITPGTVIENNLLEDKRPNYILSLDLVKDRAGCAFADVSTGEFFLYQFGDVPMRLADELARIQPSEMIVNDEARLKEITSALPAATSELPAEKFDLALAKRVMEAHFGKDEVAQSEAEQKLAIAAAGALISYLIETQKNPLTHIVHATRYDSTRYMTVDRVAAANLELTETVRGHSRRGSLLWVLDRTVTAMGSRMLRQWIEQPLIQKEEIEMRLAAVERFKDDPFALSELREAFTPVYDVERLMSKIAYESINPRDCLALVDSLKAVPGIIRILHDDETPVVRGVLSLLDPLEELVRYLENAISPDAPLALKDGMIFSAGFNEELDQLRAASTDGKGWLAALEQKEREATGIKNLKVGYNRVFGYYIEVTKSFYELVPYRYVRKQTLANCERFITDELKDLERTILGAEENAVKLEYSLFVEVRDKIKAHIKRLQRTTLGLKTLDALLSLAQVATENNYVRPTINEEGRYEIIGGRHPVVEESIGREKFVPNDTHLNEDGRVMIITGPNMAGKSTYMRQVALITLMAHIGAFVPAESADISVTDRIFTRIGASDDLYGGQSTFMVEMSEMATILKNATRRSLLILDEVGRGTSTYDGLSIAWAAVEYIAGEKCGARTMFATHYHELSELEGELEGVVNYRVTAREVGEDVIFLRKVIPGGEDRSYGVSVARLAGLPAPVIARARKIMARLEVDDEQRGSVGRSILDNRKNAGNRQVALTDFQPMELIGEIQALDVMSMSPIDALNKLFELAEKARRI